MERKKLIKRLLFPPVWVICVLTVISTAALVVVFVKALEQSPAAYVTYMLSFYTLSVVCLLFCKVLPERYKIIKQKIHSHPVGNKYMTDAAFRTHISLYVLLMMNTLYALVNVISFAFYRSMWFAVLAGYYIILSVMRFMLLRRFRKNKTLKDPIGELKSVVLCSSILLTVNFALSGAVLMILYQGRGFQYHGIMIYVMAAYTFYITAHAVVSLIKYRRQGSHIITMTKVIALSAALVSVLSLETAMLSQFGQDMPAEKKWFVIALTGAVVSTVIIAMAVYMILRSALEIKKLRGN